MKSNSDRHNHVADVLKNLASACRDRLIAWRRQFHREPELRLECRKTATAVAAHLQDLGLEVRSGIAETGVAGVLRGKQDRPVVALRVDMDALPIEEQTGLPFASQVAGAMHACGHDGHTSLGLGVATVLAGLRDRLPGTVKFIFQPGEESPGGAKRMIDAGVLQNPPVDRIVGCHIHPSIPAGSIGLCCGTVAAGAIEFVVTLTGVGGHAARPHRCKDPITAAGHFIVALQTVVSRRRDPLEPMVISLGEIHAGSGCNIIPEKVSLRGTIRYLSAEARQFALQGIEEVLAGIRSGFGIQAEFAVGEEAPPVQIREEMADLAAAAAVELFGADRVHRIRQPSMGAEDFSFFTELCPAAYFRLGCYDAERGLIHDLHHPKFDFAEDILVPGTQFGAYLIWKLLTEEST